MYVVLGVMNVGNKQRVGWIVRCRECGKVWLLEVSFDISDLDKLYHYCQYCRKNTFHDILGRAERVGNRRVERF